tara:strand:+ start:43868 stop:44680 length:813 start_codon:yes stop_codon:yes gene_type:complete
MNEEISLGELIVSVLRFIKRNFLIMGIAIFIGGVLGYFKESTKTPTYKSEAVFCSDLLEANRLKELSSDFETAVRNNNYAFLSQKLSIPIDSVKQITGIKIEIIETEATYRNDVNLSRSKLHNCIRVICSVTNAQLFNSIENSILRNFKNHPESKEIVSQRKSGYKRDIEKISNDIVFLTEQRVKLFDKIQQGALKNDINQFDTESHFIFAYEKMSELEELFLRTKVAVLMKPFNAMTVATHSKTKGIIVTVIICLFIAVTIAVFREIKL